MWTFYCFKERSETAKVLLKQNRFISSYSFLGILMAISFVQTNNPPQPGDDKSCLPCPSKRISLIPASPLIHFSFNP